MSEEAGFIRAIIADREDDMVRLAYADWLTENGQPERAEFIRVQCELAPLGTGKVLNHSMCSNPSCTECRRRRLCRRERELLKAHLGWFPKNLIPWFNDNGEISIGSKSTGAGPPIFHRFTRGFVSSLTCSWSDWSQHADAITARQPIERVKLTRAGTFLGWWEYTRDKWPRIAFDLPPEEPSPFVTLESRSIVTLPAGTTISAGELVGVNEHGQAVPIRRPPN